MGSFFSRPADTYYGEESAQHFVLVNYCGGWGYHKYATAIVDRIQAKYPGKFRILT